MIAKSNKILDEILVLRAKENSVEVIFEPFPQKKMSLIPILTC